jgi:hypothetical protein
MTTLKRSLATTAAIAIAALAAAAPASAQQPQGFVVDGPYSVQQGGTNANGIIAILIGLAQAPGNPSTFTPPIGSNKGSFTADAPRP